MRLRMMIEIHEGVSWDEWKALAHRAEDVGIDGLFSSDHYTNFHTHRSGGFDTWATLAAIAAVTQRIRLGSLMSPVGFRHPSVLARMVATVDNVSQGRVELALGAGWYEDEYIRNGFPFPSIRDRFDHLAEQLEIITRTWTEDEWDHDGERYHLQGQGGSTPLVQQPHPPLIMGASAKPRSVALAVRYAQEYNIAFATPERCTEVRAPLDRACEKAGRDPETLRLSYMTGVVLGEDAADARSRLRRILADLKRDPEGEAPENWLYGTVEQAAEILAAHARAGAATVYLQNHARNDAAAIDLMGKLATEIA